jgi:hypothetical protein
MLLVSQNAVHESCTFTEYFGKGGLDHVEAILFKIFIYKRTGYLDEEFSVFQGYRLCNGKPRIEYCFRYVVTDKIQT